MTDGEKKKKTFSLPPFLIGICGAGSGSGKTTMAGTLLRMAVLAKNRKTGPAPPYPPTDIAPASRQDKRGRTPSPGALSLPWGAIKFTRTAMFTSVETGQDVLSEEGKDTARMLGAGAARAVWVRSPGGPDLEEALSIALAQLQGCGVVLAEGNSAVELLKPDIVIFMSGPFFKSGAESALRNADVVFRPEGAVFPAGAGATKKDAVFCGSLESCATAVFALLGFEAYAAKKGARADERKTDAERKIKS